MHVGRGDLDSCSLKETATYFYGLMGCMQFMPFGTSYIKPLSNCFFLLTLKSVIILRYFALGDEILKDHCKNV